MTTNYSESYTLSTKSNHRRFLSYVPWKGYKQNLFGCFCGETATKVAKTVFTTKWFMILRTPTEDENRGPFTRFPATRHSRAGENPGFFPIPISLDTRWSLSWAATSKGGY